MLFAHLSDLSSYHQQWCATIYSHEPPAISFPYMTMSSTNTETDELNVRQTRATINNKGKCHKTLLHEQRPSK